MKLLGVMILMGPWLAWSAPLIMQGDWKQSGEVIGHAQVEHRLVPTSEVAAWQSQKFICQPSSQALRSHCQRRTSKAVTLPKSVSEKFSANSFQRILFQPTSETYSLTNDSELLKEWSLGQTVLADSRTYPLLLWREVSGSPARIAWPAENPSLRFELLISSETRMERILKTTEGAPPLWTEYWGRVIYVATERSSTDESNHH